MCVRVWGFFFRGEGACVGLFLPSSSPPRLAIQSNSHSSHVGCSSLPTPSPPHDCPGSTVTLVVKKWGEGREGAGGRGKWRRRQLHFFPSIHPSVRWLLFLLLLLLLLLLFFLLLFFLLLFFLFFLFLFLFLLLFLLLLLYLPLSPPPSSSPSPLPLPPPPPQLPERPKNQEEEEKRGLPSSPLPSPFHFSFAR